MKKPTKSELTDLLDKVQNEGFGYYILDYGPDLSLLSRMGFDKKELTHAITLLREVQNAIDAVDVEE